MFPPGARKVSQVQVPSDLTLIKIMDSDRLIAVTCEFVALASEICALKKIS